MCYFLSLFLFPLNYISNGSSVEISGQNLGYIEGKLKFHDDLCDTYWNMDLKLYTFNSSHQLTKNWSKP